MLIKSSFANDHTKKYSCKYMISLCLSFFFCCALSSFVQASNPSQRVWYRYYDKNGVANISTSVTPAHIRNGYETLDSNMQVIRRNQAFNSQHEQNKSSTLATQSRQRESDQRLKLAYSNSNVAIHKKQEQLVSIEKQIFLQKKQLRQYQSAKLSLKKLQNEYVRKSTAVPNQLKKNILSNNQHINQTQINIENLQTNYRNTEQYYDNIIKRLKALE